MDDDTDGATPPAEQPTTELPVLSDRRNAAPEQALPAPTSQAERRPAGRHRHTPARRWFLVGSGAVLAGAGAGVAAELVQRRTRTVPAPPRALVAAAAAERTLIADLDATTGGTPEVRRLITQARADHVAHLRALDALVADYGTPPTASAAASSRPKGTPRTRQQLRAAEGLAATAAARRAGGFSGARAALLASIAACEATHADLLA